MGTSINQSSPPTASWHFVFSAYMSPAIPSRRIVQEIWRAATNQTEGDLRTGLSSPTVAKCFKIALESHDVKEAVSTASRMIALSGTSTVATDIAMRALVLSFLKGKDRKSTYVGALFSETLNYLVARDLPGYVGKSDRLENVSASISFKNQLKSEVETLVLSQPIPEQVLADMSIWKSYIYQTIDFLKVRKE